MCCPLVAHHDEPEIGALVDEDVDPKMAFDGRTDCGNGDCDMG